MRRKCGYTTLTPGLVLTSWVYRCSSPLKCRTCCRDLSVNHPPGFTFYPSHTCLLVMVLCNAQITWIVFIQTLELLFLEFAPEFAPNIMKYRVETLNLCSAEPECEVACTNTTSHQAEGGWRKWREIANPNKTSIIPRHRHRRCGRGLVPCHVSRVTWPEHGDTEPRNTSIPQLLIVTLSHM